MLHIVKYALFLNDNVKYVCACMHMCVLHVNSFKNSSFMEYPLTCGDVTQRGSNLIY